jgi:hypothetical protein
LGDGVVIVYKLLPGECVVFGELFALVA